MRIKIIAQLPNTVETRKDSGQPILLTKELIDKIELILIEHGQHDLQFKLGEWIKYTPFDVAKILREEMEKVGRANHGS